MCVKLFFRVISKALLCISVFLLMSCDSLVQTSSLEKVQKRGDIIMGTINSSLTHSFDGTVHSGLDYELAKQFAEYLNVELTVKEYDSLNALFLALDNEKVDFLGSGLTLTPNRAEKYRSSPPYYYVSQKVVYHKGTYKPREIADVNAPISVLANSSHAETLISLIEENPHVEINYLNNEDQETLLQKVAQKEVRFAIVDSSTLAQKQRYYPELAEAFTISEKRPVAWLINRNQDDSIYAGMIEFIGNKYNDQTIAQLEEKYFGHVGHFDYVDTRVFLKRIESTLPTYKPLFKKYQNDDIDWQLLASLSYQESHWDPKAKSPTGVRGLMMLTQATAKYVGVKNRLDPEQSVQGGAKYLSQLVKRLPETINENERLWFALASYNIGYGHLMDARRITVMKNENPNSWSDVKENLPLLHQKKWYSKTRYGYARGREAQHYVKSIRQYLETLNWFVLEEEKALKIEAEKQAEIARLAAIEEKNKQAEIDRAEAAEKTKQAEETKKTNKAEKNESVTKAENVKQTKKAEQVDDIKKVTQTKAIIKAKQIDETDKINKAKQANDAKKAQAIKEAEALEKLQAAEQVEIAKQKEIAKLEEMARLAAIEEAKQKEIAKLEEMARLAAIKEAQQKAEIAKQKEAQKLSSESAEVANDVATTETLVIPNKSEEKLIPILKENNTNEVINNNAN